MLIVGKMRPEKAETKRVRFTFGGNLIPYPGDVSTPTAGTPTAKCLFNSVMSTPDAEFMMIEIKDFYLNTFMEHYEYMRIPVKVISAWRVDYAAILARISRPRWLRPR
jgi:hypothetical protein